MNRSAGLRPVRYSFLLFALCLATSVIFLILLSGCGNSSLVSSGPTSTPPSSGGTTPTAGGTTPPSNSGGASAQFAYVALTAASGVAGVQVSGSGTASAIAGSPFAAPGATSYIARHGQFVFAVVGDFLSATAKILTYTQDASGKLTLSSTLQYAHPLGPLAVDPGGTHLYALMTGTGIAAFAISSNGQLSELSGSPYTTFNGISGPVVVAQNDRFLYALGDVGQHDVNVPVIYTFPLNTSTGQLLPVSSFNFVRVDATLGLAITPDSRYALANNAGQNQLCAYALDQNTGAPTPLSSSFVAIPAACIGTGSGPTAVAVHPGGRWVAVANALSNNVSMYSFTGGTFTIVAGSPFSSGVQPQNLAFGSDGRYLFVSNTNSGDVSVYAVNSSTGALTVLAGSPVQVGSRPGPIAAP